MKIALTIPGSSDQPSQSLASPSGIPRQLGGDLSTSGTQLFQTGVTWLLFVAATLAILVMMWAGIQWITSSGDPIKLASAKRRLLYAIVGLVIAVSAFFIVRLIITILGGNSANFFTPGHLLEATTAASLVPTATP